MTGDLPHGYRRLGPQRIRENVGLGYDDLAPGLTIEHRPGRTITETDNLLMTTMAGNVAPIHTDADYAATTRWGRLLVCGAVTLTIVTGMTVRSISGQTFANIALDKCRFTHPVFIGDTLYADTCITGRRPSASRPGTGIVTCHTTACNQHDQQVISFTRTFLLPLDATHASTRY